MSSKRLKRSSGKIVDYKEIKTSDSDPAIEITSLEHIPSKTSSWTKNDCNSLGIYYANAKTINEIIISGMITNETKNKPYSTLILEGWNKNTFILADDSEITSHKTPKVITIIRKIRNILHNEEASSIRETKVDSFIMTLLEYLGFDEEPFLMHPQYDYTAIVGNDHRITSKVEYMITKKDLYIVLIIEDKHSKGTSEFTDWSEHQIAGEIFGSSYHNVDIAAHGEHNMCYPLQIYAIRIVGTKFTFYKAEVNKQYLQECVTGLPTKNNLIIKRYPIQPDADPNQIRILNAWDFCQQNDREHILKTLKALYEFNY